jgi:hypothetical protein
MRTILNGIYHSKDELANAVGAVSEVQLARIAGRIDAYNAVLDMEIEDEN